jgi:UDP-N-acetylmuramate dehydrogenase
LTQGGLDRVASDLRGEARKSEPLAAHTALRIGGPADLFIEPDDLADLRVAVGNLQAEGIDYFVIGGGYNLLVRDGGFRGCAISLRRIDTLRILSDDRLEVGAGVTNGMLCRIAAENCLSGVEFLCGIPGSFGGALAMNAGAHGGETLRRVESLVTLRGGEVVTRDGVGLEFGYRYLKLEPGEIVVSARLVMEQAERRDIEERMTGYLTHRGGAQRVAFPNAGSFFKNPPGQQAWRLIDQAGLRGLQVGGAQVSEVHANFLVNRGVAKATDFLALAALVKVKVQEVCGVQLEEEVRVIGEG